MTAMLRRRFLVTLEVTSKDKAYPWVLQWISAQGVRTQHLSVETAFTAPTSVVASSARGGIATGTGIKFQLVPGPGQHFIRYRGRILGKMYEK